LSDLVHVFDDHMLSGAPTSYAITVTMFNDVGAPQHRLCL